MKITKNRTIKNEAKKCNFFFYHFVQGKKNIEMHKNLLKPFYYCFSGTVIPTKIWAQKMIFITPPDQPATALTTVGGESIDFPSAFRKLDTQLRLPS